MTLRCFYNTDYSGGIYLHWYRQYPNRAPQYILRRGAKSYSKLSDTAEFAKKRFSSQADDSSTVLTIRSLERADTAVYYCGLPRAQCRSRLAEQHKNPPFLVATEVIEAGGRVPQKTCYIVKRINFGRGAKRASDAAGFSQKRFSSQADDSSTVLNITDMRLADTAMNY
ncbi:unnamed protein product [Caretta caretta]